MRNFILMSVCVSVLLGLVGCGLFTPPEAREEMARLETVITDSAKRINVVAEQIESLKEKMDTGEMAAEDYMVELAPLIREGKQLYSNIKEGRESMEALREEHKIPYWKMGLAGAGAIISVLFGTGGISTARKARTGIGVLVDAIEQGGTVSEIKKRVSKKHNPEVERLVPR